MPARVRRTPLSVTTVLRKPGKAERQSLDVATEVAADAVEAIATEGVAVAMNRFNTRD